MRGGKPKSEMQKRLAGNPGKRKIKTSKLKASGSPVCPPWLGKEAQLIWVRAMEVAPWLTSADEFKLAGFCQAIADVQWAVKKIAVKGYTIKARQGEIPHPANGIKNKALTIIAKFGSDLGFDPAMRARVTEPDAAKTTEDALASEFFPRAAV